MQIELTPVEMMIAGQVGTMRRVKSRQMGLKDKDLSSWKASWGNDFDGAAAEMALAKYLNVYWDGSVNSFKQPDVGEFQVRSTNLLNGRLIIRPNDAVDDEIFVLVLTGEIPTISIVGWFRCGDAKKEKYWDDNAWWVPQEDLDKNLEFLKQRSSHG